MELVAIVTVLALVEYLYIGVRVGGARQKYEVAAPATTGHPVFERTYRVQQNTVEQLVVFLPALWLCAVYASAGLAAVLGLVFIVGRALYLRGYVDDPARRGLGFGVTFAANALLLVAGLVGAVVALF